MLTEGNKNFFFRNIEEGNMCCGLNVITNFFLDHEVVFKRKISKSDFLLIGIRKI